MLHSSLQALRKNHQQSAKHSDSPYPGLPGYDPRSPVSSMIIIAPGISRVVSGYQHDYISEFLREVDL
ncbi:uncharacterized protein N7500_001194 [Penicillium coprophilum]|uniref:uncharacterized protein n=1 Tax=Penicillium coprophilum TaxID=36646 RepID=UPI002388E7CE|nr:uncharacterized protein N7500_001194 [Penicillium coprophilum]KAJ5178495.1 hypothetical protein N7500_001194 [Penicillium coprophilum]